MGTMAVAYDMIVYVCMYGSMSLRHFHIHVMCVGRVKWGFVFTRGEQGTKLPCIFGGRWGGVRWSSAKDCVEKAHRPIDFGLGLLWGFKFWLLLLSGSIKWTLMTSPRIPRRLVIRHLCDAMWPSHLKFSQFNSSPLLVWHYKVCICWPTYTVTWPNYKYWTYHIVWVN